MDIKNNQFFQEILTKNFSSHIYEAAQKDFYPSLTGNNTITGKTPFLDGMFDLYFNTFGFTSSQFLDYKGVGNNIANIREMIADIFSNPIAFCADSFENWIELFENSLYSDPLFFKYVFIKMLNTDISNSLKEKKFSNNTTTLSNRYNDFFQTLITIGKEQNHFKHFKENELFTSIDKNYDLLKKENITNIQFNTEKLVKYLKSEKNIPFIKTFYNDIVNLNKKDLHDFFDTIREIANNNKDHEDIVVKFFSNFLSQIADELLIYEPNTNISNNEIIAKKEKREKNPLYLQTVDFFDNVLEYEFIHSFIIQSNQLHQLLIQFPKVFTKFLESSEYNFNYTINDKETNFDEYRKDKNILNTFVAFMKSNDYRIQFDEDVKNALSFLFKISTSYIKAGRYYSLNDDNDNFNLPNKIIALFLSKYVPSYIFKKKTDNPLFEEIDNTILNDFLLSKTHIVNDVYHAGEPNYFITQKTSLVQYYQTILSKEEKNNFMNRIKADMQNSLFQIIRKGDVYSSDEKTLNMINYYIRSFNDIDVLNVLNINNENHAWLNISVDFNRKAKIPLAFYIIDKTEGVALEWFARNENINSFLGLKYKNKNFIHFIKETHYFHKSFMKIAEKKEMFESLFMKNKHIINALTKGENYYQSTSEHKDMIKTIEFFQLSQKLTPKKEAKAQHKPSIVNKI